MTAADRPSPEVPVPQPPGERWQMMFAVALWQSFAALLAVYMGMFVPVTLGLVAAFSAVMARYRMKHPPVAAPGVSQ